ncbi:hypothetical protein E7T04_12020 [Enterococcus faecalis]|uniref:hypothetical protein n=1 Tax=Enterococcus faecalis TaxID=1351 RepID=UPI0010CD6548|nr:hypothetical protein [Enterococcus faecalis]EGO9466059.1 hypothetical protein [Enterococcus faecalis]NSV63564.1 hypothetical protein [Enterococcus faecalis]QCR02342.1 hypothetical protein E7T04_12020 [Enterococcus faecalis]TQA70225.1 hypothetical protein FKZ09_07320 [Enterococcus faecalis]
MNISNQIKENLEERRKINEEDDFGLEKSWASLTNILSKSEDETINYLKNCSKEDVLLISSVFDDVSEKLQSRKFISCLRELDKKYSDLKLTFFIDDAESYIVN